MAGGGVDAPSSTRDTNALRSGSLTVQELAQVLVKLQTWEWGSALLTGHRAKRR